MTSPSSPSNIESSRRLNINFQLARHRIEAFAHYPNMIRARALVAYIRVFAFADQQGVVEASSEQIAQEFEIGRPSWPQYSALLEEAGLLEVEPLRGGTQRGFRLLPPTDSDIRSVKTTHT